MSEARPHLDAGTFTAKRQAGPDGKQTAEEFHRNHPKRGRRKFAMQYCLDVRDAASRRVRRKAAHQPRGKRCRCGVRDQNEQKTENGLAMRPCNQRVPHAVRLLQSQPKNRSDNSRNRAHDQRQYRQRQKAAVALYRDLRLFQVIGHSGSVTGVGLRVNIAD
jgi:hypothetical protein